MLQVFILTLPPNVRSSNLLKRIITAEIIIAYTADYVQYFASNPPTLKDQPPLSDTLATVKLHFYVRVLVMENQVVTTLNI
jgi:hypothetical protein